MRKTQNIEKVPLLARGEFEKFTGVSNYRFPLDPGIPPGRANSGEKTAVSQTLANSVNFLFPYPFSAVMLTNVQSN